MSQFPGFQGNPVPLLGAGLDTSNMAPQQYRDYSHTVNKLSQTNQQLEELKNIRSSTRGFRSPEIDEKDRQIFRLQLQLEETKRQLEQQQERILQQQATIKHQSDAIQNPKPGNQFTTPHRRDELQVASAANMFWQTPPSFDISKTKGQAQEPLRSIYGAKSSHNNLKAGAPALSPSFAPSRTKSQKHHTNSPYQPGTESVYAMRFSPSTQTTSWHSNELVSPEPVQNPRRASPRLEHSRSSSDTSSYYPTPKSQMSDHGNIFGPIQPPQHANKPAPQGLQPSPMSLMKASEGSHLVGIGAKFKQVFKMSETYAFSHCNIPSTAGDNALPGAIKDRLIRAATADTAYYIMSSAQTRYFLVAKIINQWMAKHILKASVYKGFNNDIDANIEKARDQIFQTTPTQIRYLYLSTIANEMRNLRSDPNFAAFGRNLCRERGNQLWAIIKPLMHKKTTKDWDDLLYLMQEAHKLAEMMFAGSDEYRIEFMEIGRSFEQNLMHNRDPFLQGVTNADLNNAGAVVRLGVSPYITYRSNGAGGTLSSGQIMMADVLVRKRDL